MKILLQAIKSLLRKLENCFREDGIIKQTSLPKGYPYSGTIIEILPSITVEFTNELMTEPIFTKFTLVAGTEYTVTWNGVKYDCIARRGSSIVGDGVGVGSDSASDEEFPFYILALDTPMDAGDGRVGYGILLSKDSSTSTTFSISGNLITKMDARYLPETALSNLVNGSAEGSLRSIYSEEESNRYVMGTYAVALGESTTASGHASYAEGRYTTASGYASYAEGNNTTASGDCSHAEGDGTTASGSRSHAEGDGTTASGSRSHAEGDGTTASGSRSHAEGVGTVASGDYSHVQGKYNIEDTADKYAHIVGNGSKSGGVVTLSNAHTLDWDGNAWFAGTMEGTALILKSSTANSAKRFRITVDDSGTLSATEITA